MNILENITVAELRLRPFIYEDANSTLGDFPISIDVHRIYGVDPKWIQYSPFKGGYDISFIVSTTTDLTSLVNSSQMVEVVAVSNCSELIQIGSSEGFKITSIKPPAAQNLNLRSYQFQTIKPNNQPFITRTK